MPDEVVIKVEEETPVVEAVESSVAEQAAAIVETAQDLAQDLARTPEQHAEIIGILHGIEQALVLLATSNDSRHIEILDRIAALELNVADVADEVEDIPEATPEVAENAEELAAAAVEVSTATAEVAVTAEEKPQARGKRRWI